ncbi:MAG: M14 family metallopeptidase [Alphaproteobacteria bacterium]|nr:M14 family metallopeptidase [Alphaproteobacteria bacterium]
MTAIAANFATDYQDARQKFCAAAATCGGQFRSYRNPTLGPDGGRLFMDTVRFGEDDAPNMLVMMAATHGVEGFCGSGAMVNWLRAGGPAKLPKGTGALLIHGVNPHGFAWIRRVNEDNVDLNRNFVDHAKPYPKNDGYIELADALTPRRWDEASLAAAQKMLDSYAQKHGAFGQQGAITGGQYTHSNGIFFGGHKPTWSNRTIRAVIRTELGHARRVGCIDFHTGLGPFGHGELIGIGDPGLPAFARQKAWYGDELTSPEAGTSKSAVVVGVVLDAFPQEAPDAEFTGIAIEYGTYPVAEVLDAVRRDNWLHQRGDLNSAQGKEMKAYMQERFYPAGAKWAELVWARAEQVIGMAVRGLNR